MEFMEYTEDYTNPEVAEIAAELIDPTIKELEKKHGDVDPEIYRNAVRAAVEAILTQTDGNLKGVRVLDLGCGSKPQLDPCCPGEHEPWLCRSLHLMGAHPIGVDLGNLKGEGFEAYQLDLMREDALHFIPDNSIDVIHNRELVASPTFCRLYGYEGIDWLYQHLRPQMDRIFKESGIYIISDSM
ncbi:hypothetical protein ACFL21_01670 [Patescibacteria group bacterium]